MLAVRGVLIPQDRKEAPYRRMKQEEARLGVEVKELLQHAQEADEEEDRCYGRRQRGDELPRELAFRESRLRKIKETKEALETEAKWEAEDLKIVSFVVTF